MKFKKFTVRDSTYEYAFDDRCIVLKVGKRIMYIDPVILPKLNKLANRFEKGKAIEVVEKSESETWKTVRKLTRKVSRHDEIGFFTVDGLKEEHWVLRKGGFPKTQAPLTSNTTGIEPERFEIVGTE